MRLLLRSARRVWTRRPAGPALVALGLLVTTLLAAGGTLALQSAQVAEERATRGDLGRELARAWTPGGYTLEEATLTDLQREIAAARGLPAPRHAPVFLERDALVSSPGGTTSGWTLLGLPAGTLEAWGLPVPAGDEALVDARDRPVPRGEAVLRVQRPGNEDVVLAEGHPGRLARCVLVGDTYVHDDEDVYEFTLDVIPGARTLLLHLTTAGNDTDFDIEAVAPNGTTYLDDAGTAAEPQAPRLNLTRPAGGNWTVRVHAKLADGVAFRLEERVVFNARDAEAVGRLLQGEGWRAVGADLGLTDQARVPVRLQPTDLAPLGPGSGLAVMELDALRASLDLPGRGSGVLVLGGGGESVLEGLAPGALAALEQVVADVRSRDTASLDPVQGLRLDATATEARALREARLASTGRLLDVALPTGALAGVVLAAWAAGLHASRLAGEVRVLAGLGQPLRRSYALAALHLAPPAILGTAAGLLLAPLLGRLIARGAGLPAAPPGLPPASILLVPALALLPVGLVAWLALRHPAVGGDPRQARRPPPLRRRALVAGVWAAGGLALLLAAAVLDLPPTRRYLAGAAAAAALALALLWAPLLEPLLRRARLATVPALGLHRTRSTHATLGLAAATAALVLASLVSGLALGQAASPDVHREAGGYDVLARTPAPTEDLGALLDEGSSDLLRATVGIEYLFRVEGTGLHDLGEPSGQVVHGIDSSFAQRHRHDVRALDPAVPDPVTAVARRTDAALVTPSLAGELQGDSVTLEGPLGRRTYTVVGILDTRLLEGVYLSKEAFPVHFTTFEGDQRIRLAPGVDPAKYSADLRAGLADDGGDARTAEALVQERLAGQLRAGATLQALALAGVAVAVLLDLLVGLRATADRRGQDAVLLALGAPSRDIAAGIATETLLPVAAGVLLAALVTLPLAPALADVEGLAFPLAPVDASGLLRAAALTLAGLLLVGLLLAGALGWRAARALDGGTLREVE